MDDPYGTLPPEPIRVEKMAPEHPQRIGRYRVERVLGQGGFGLVYLAHDDQLQRPVAIKVPHSHLVSNPEDAEAYLTEARTVASLDHPHIVPVYDVGSTEQFPCFVVSKLIEGSTLTQRTKANRPSWVEAVELVATVAETLHYAHRKGLVHRDIKPGNILLDTSSKPFVADFGLSLREADVGKGPRYAGTPAYMSPEQARGEGHRVDGRSDLFSLGVVFYELLTGRRPFKADSVDDLLEQVKDVEARPLRQWDDTIPKELERICLKALSKRASDRYLTGKDMADDLRHFFQHVTEDEKRSLHSRILADAVPSRTPASTPVPNPVPTPFSDSQPVRIVPKGLRSFDAHDADFFLELLPGPRDRDGLPDSIRFWKTRIEETDPDNTFAVGLIYGPSGCGKSSLVKAGLLPHLSDKVTAVYVEATAEETETRLLNGLRKRYPTLVANLGLKETLAALRRGQGISAGQKVLIVLDQFEQWLHAKKEEDNTELVQAVRQCDGSRVQCIVMVRDDFWLAVSRFVRDLEVDLVPGSNIALVDLFDLDHARKVLASFGRAFGKLPEKSSETSKEQQEFVNQAVSGLSQENKVICVRLALFAEMMKGRSWTPTTLKAVGGTEGVGVTFLEDTFSSPTANPKHRLHQNAARAVLKSLLPESGTDIKGHMRSHAELLAASGYANRPRDFEDLLRILDNEIRLLTPTDPEGKEENTLSSVQAGEKYYQLTHDYLVPSLREWLTRKQKETRRGRAELRLAERAAQWTVKQESRHLPAWWEWANIRLFTRKKSWTPPQRRMMRKAGRYHAVRGAALAAVLLVVTVAGLGIRDRVIEQNRATHAAGLVQRLLDADIAQVPGIIDEMKDYRHWTDPLLRDAYGEAERKGRETATEAEKIREAGRQLHASLALLPVDPGHVKYLSGRLLDAAPNEVPVIRDALAPYQDELLARLWAVAEAPEKGKESQRLRAASALAAYDPDGKQWASAQEAVANDLVGVPAVHLAGWMESLRPVRGHLLTPLSVIFRDGQRRDAERSLATDVLADYAADKPDRLADLILDADEKQFAVLYPKLADQRERGLPLLTGEIDKKLPSDLPSSDEKREKLAKRQANAAVALLRMNRPEKVWPLLKFSPDPRVRSYLIHRLSPLGADVGAIIKRLDKEPDVTIRRALLLSLGEFGSEQLPAASREALIPRMLQLYRDDPDPGLHGAAEWLLRQWNQDGKIKEIDEAWVKDKKNREERRENIERELFKGQTNPQWYVNGQGQSMVVLPGPVEFLMGSPPTETDRYGGPKGKQEQQHRKRIGHSFAIATREVTVAQFRQFRKDHGYSEEYSPTRDCPVNRVLWYDAAAYCNWLSNQEGIPPGQWCYLPNDKDEYAEGMKLAPDYLKRTGYRLPSEAEWEYACRARTVTSRYYGETEELLGKYAWYTKNSKDRGMLPGLPGHLGVRGNCLKPNDFGLFDLLGNALEWCQESARSCTPGEEGKPSEDIEDKRDITDKISRVLRGGSFVYQALSVRSAPRFYYVPATRDLNFGFRPARTFR